MLNLTFKRHFSVCSPLQNVIKQVTVIGSGLMGQGIAQVTAEAGFEVNLVDQNESILNKSMASIKTSLQRIAKKKYATDVGAGEKHIEETMSRLKPVISLESSARKSDLIIEAIVENLQAKHVLFSKLDKIAPTHALFASNTSSLSIEDIFKVVSRKDKVGGLHFFNPVPMMKLLEVIRTPHTSDETFKSLLEFGKSIGKTTVDCKDTPGFIVNRLLVPYMLEAVRMHERGDASTQDIDTAMKLGAGYPMGPFELADYVGLDTLKFILDGWKERFPNEQAFKQSISLEKLVKEGKLGRKSGEGFYSYKKSKI